LLQQNNLTFINNPIIPTFLVLPSFTDEYNFFVPIILANIQRFPGNPDVPNMAISLFLIEIQSSIRYRWKKRYMYNWLISLNILSMLSNYQ